MQGQMQIQSQLTPQQQQKFQMLDKDRSGTISASEVGQAYSNLKFPVQSAKLLIAAVCDKPTLTMQTYPMFDSVLNQAYQAFMQVSMQRQSINLAEVQQAIQVLRLPIQQNVLQFLVMKYDLDKTGIEFGEFLACVAYIMICQKLMKQYDPQNKGVLQVDYNGLTSLGLWFM
uniref:EF-hand domain-containing protein n=1 Tax=Trepomonas sp. PC1 TaxID=1076344 RepID=A0A146K9F1_9EUKA|eukprot:JAP93440.1 hypothetical protein TPC1_14281 [Trepomonas sp. PC1]